VFIDTLTSRKLNQKTFTVTGIVYTAVYLCFVFKMSLIILRSSCTFPVLAIACLQTRAAVQIMTDYVTVSLKQST
jgi:hypothetical protein